jgi:hypothetical protein
MRHMRASTPLTSYLRSRAKKSAPRGQFDESQGGQNFLLRSWKAWPGTTLN